VQSFNYVTVSGIGAGAVFAMVKAVSQAREYLQQDGATQDIVCFADMVKVQLPNREDETTSLRLVLMLSS
jgi:stage V sporulation protein SpoVS